MPPCTVPAAWLSALQRMNGIVGIPLGSHPPLMNTLITPNPNSLHMLISSAQIAQVVPDALVLHFAAADTHEAAGDSTAAKEVYEKLAAPLEGDKEAAAPAAPDAKDGKDAKAPTAEKV